MGFIKDCLKGICLGAGAILPGISSGVLCVIFGIYDKLVESVLGIFKDFKKNFFYLLPIVLGAFIGVLLFGNMLNFLFSSYPTPTQYTFIGLILGSIPILLRNINKGKTIRLHYFIYTIVAFGIGLLAVILENYMSTNILSTDSNMLKSLSTNTPFSFSSIIILIIAGFFMSIGIVVPGVSSTLILMCFGIYDFYLNAISTMNLSILIPLATGVIIGGFIFLKIIKYLLDNYHMQTFYSIIGFTLGSILVLYVPISFNFIGLASVLLFIGGFYIASLLENRGN